MVLKIPRLDDSVIGDPSDDEDDVGIEPDDISDDVEIPDFDNDDDIPSFSSDENLSDHENLDQKFQSDDESENEILIKPKTKKRGRILDESDEEADAPNEQPLSTASRKGPKEPLNKKPKLSAEEVRKLVHEQKDEKETDTNKKQSIMIDALPQPERKAIHRGISTETIDKITKKPETSVPSTSKLFQRSQSVDSKISKSSSSRIRHTHFAQFSKEDQDIRKKRLAEIEIAKKTSKEKEPSVSETVSKK